MIQTANMVGCFSRQYHILHYSLDDENDSIFRIFQLTQQNMYVPTFKKGI